MRLSADRINRKSPYWVIQLDEMTFRFKTRNGIIYRVGFYQDQYFLGNRAYHFFIANDSETNPPKDNDVFRVITCVLEEFFRLDASVMLYICDPYDHREAIRDSLYKRWFNSYPVSVSDVTPCIINDDCLHCCPSVRQQVTVFA